MKVADSAAGKRAKCPSCGATIPIRGAANIGPDMATIALDEGVRGPVKDCPSCCGPMPLDGVFCVRCGFDLRTGRKVDERKFSSSSASHGSEGLRGRVLGFIRQALPICVIAVLGVAVCYGLKVFVPLGLEALETVTGCKNCGPGLWAPSDFEVRDTSRGNVELPDEATRNFAKQAGFVLQCKNCGRIVAP